MQILTRFNKVIAYSEYGYIPVGNSAVCVHTNECHDDALIVEVDCVPTDIDCYDYYYINGRFIKGDDNSKIRETNKNGVLRFWVGTQDEYSALPAEAKEGLFAIITDGMTEEQLNKTLNSLTAETSYAIETLSKMMKVVQPWEKGTSAVPKAEMDVDGNTIPTTYSKKSESRREVTSSLPTDKTIYNSSASTQPRLDLSGVMLAGKTASDTIGVSGKLSVTIGGDSATAGFSVLWSDSNTGEVNTIAICGSKAYVVKFTIGVDTSNKLYCSAGFLVSGTPRYAYDISGGTAATPATIKVESLNIFYK